MLQLGPFPEETSGERLDKKLYRLGPFSLLKDGPDGYINTSIQCTVMQHIKRICKESYEIYTHTHTHAHTSITTT